MPEKNKKLVLEKISNADMVLVGVGKELAADEKETVQYREIESTYEQLARLLADKNYFVVTTNTDDCILHSSITTDRIVAPCGSIHRFQCSKGCTEQIFDAKDAGICPVCGAALCENTVKAEHYVEAGYLPQWNRYMKWLPGTLNKQLCVLELGVLMDFPTIIRFPFEKTTFINEKAFLIRINERLPQLSAELKGRGMSVRCRPSAFLNDCFTEKNMID